MSDVAPPRHDFHVIVEVPVRCVHIPADSKLVGSGNAGMYFSVLQSNGAISRVLAGQLVGYAYGGLGIACVWGSVLVIWSAQWFAFLSMWRRITPTAIADMHSRLATEETTIGGANVAALLDASALSKTRKSIV